MRILFFIVVALSFSFYAMEESETQELLREAERCFETGNEAKSRDEAVELWRKAAARYERAVREGGLANGPLFYNLGNVYFRLGDTGRAILNYRRAQRFIPNDRNLLKNLAYARRSRKDTVEEQESRKVLRTLLFWHYDLSLATRENIFIACFCAIWLFALLRIFWKRPWLKTATFGLLFVAIVMAASMVETEYRQRKIKEGVVIAEEIVGRKGNSDSYEPSFKEPLHAGTEFTVVEQRGAWLEIRLANGMGTWIPEEAAELL